MVVAARPNHRRRPSIARGSLRVQGWLYTVLWPLREALARELHHLESGDATWRRSTARLESLREPKAHLGAAGRANLDDLIELDGRALPAEIDRCGAAQARLAVAATQAHHDLTGAVREAAARARRRTREADEQAFEAIAEDLVNNTTTREVANREAELIDALRDQLPHLRNGRYPELDAALREAVAATRDLLDLVDATRRRLCDRYDLPPAPVNGQVSRNGHGP